MRKCGSCGKLLKQKPNEWKSRFKSRKFCNVECSNTNRPISKGTEYRRKKVDGIMMPLHKAIWEDKNGKVPDGFLVHHKDENKLNNSINNLELMSYQKHCEFHNQKHPKTKICVICGDEFQPEPTKRKRAQCCSWECGRKLSIKNNPTIKK